MTKTNIGEDKMLALLINNNLVTVTVKFPSSEKTYIYFASKKIAKTLRKDDYVLVPDRTVPRLDSDNLGSNDLAIVKVVGVDGELDIDPTQININWKCIVHKLDLSYYDETMSDIDEGIASIEKARRRKVKQDMLAKVDFDLDV